MIIMGNRKVIPPGIRVTYHGSSMELSIARYGNSRYAEPRSWAAIRISVIIAAIW